MKSEEKNKIQTSINIDEEPAHIWNTLVTLSNYRRWNPIVSHAIIYGPVAAGSEIKALSGRWDLRFIITDVSPERMIEIEGGGIGLKVKLRIGIKILDNGCEVEIDANLSGWIFRLFPKRTKTNMEASFDLFLTALQRRVSRGSSYEIIRDDYNIEDEGSDRSMPTPFNLLYRTRKKKSRKGKSRLN